MFFAGGYSNTANHPSVSNVVDIYNTSTGIWSTATLSQARGDFSATSAGNEVFFAGGVQRRLRRQQRSRYLQHVHGNLVHRDPVTGTL